MYFLYFAKEIHVCYGKCWKETAKGLLTHKWPGRQFDVEPSGPGRGSPSLVLATGGSPALLHLCVGVGEGLHAEDPRCHLSHLQGQARGPRSVVSSLEQVQWDGQGQAVPWDSIISCSWRRRTAHVSAAPPRCWQSMATVALQHGMTWKASLWARQNCPSRSFPEPCGRPGFWAPQATWLSSHPSELEQVFRSAWLPLPYPPFPAGLRVDFTPARPEAPAPCLRSHLPSSRRS